MGGVETALDIISGVLHDKLITYQQFSQTFSFEIRRMKCIDRSGLFERRMQLTGHNQQGTTN